MKIFKRNVLLKKERDGKKVIMKGDSTPEKSEPFPVFDRKKIWGITNPFKRKRKDQMKVDKEVHEIISNNDEMLSRDSVNNGFVIMRNKDLNKKTRFAQGISPLQINRSRYQIFDEGGHFKDGFDIYDRQTQQRHKIDFAFCGNDTRQCATWDFAPLCEMREVDGNGFNAFRTRLHQDDNFVERQLMMNRREDIFHRAGQNKGVTDNGLHMFGGQFRDPITQTDFFMTSDVRYGKELPPLLQRIEYRINPIFKPLVRKTHNTTRWINKYLKLNRSPEEILKVYAEKRSKELLKSWLTEKEYESLMNLGEMEIYNDDEIYIVKKNPHETVVVKKGDQKEEFCIIPKEYGYAGGDVLLTKIMMIKTDPQNFKKVAIKR